jgi:hypothetical protein
MALRTIFLVLTGAAVLVNGFSLGMIMAALNKRGQKTNPFLVRLYFFKYLRTYRDITRKETGKPGPFYGLWIGSFILLLAFALAAIIVTRI